MFVGFRLSGVNDPLKDTTHEIWKSTPQLAFQWARDISNESKNRTGLTDILVELLTLGALNEKVFGPKNVQPLPWHDSVHTFIFSGAGN